MDNPARMIGQPFPDLGMLVSGVVVGDGMDQLSRWYGPLNGTEKLNEFLVGVLGHAATNHSAVEDIQGREQGGGAVPLVVVGHGGAFAQLQRQAGLGAVEGLDLALLVD